MQDDLLLVVDLGGANCVQLGDDGGTVVVGHDTVHGVLDSEEGGVMDRYARGCLYKALSVLLPARPVLPVSLTLSHSRQSGPSCRAPGRRHGSGQSSRSRSGGRRRPGPWRRRRGSQRGGPRAESGRHSDGGRRLWRRRAAGAGVGPGRGCVGWWPRGTSLRPGRPLLFSGGGS